MSSQYEAYIGQAAQAGNQYLNKVQGQTVPGETATQVLSETMQKADKLISRILHLSNRLCGAEPTSMCAGQALYVESSIDGQIVAGPRFYSLPEIVRWLGDDASRITHRIDDEFIDLTEQLADTWIGMYCDSEGTLSDSTPEYVKTSTAWQDFFSDYYPTQMRIALSFYGNAAGRRL